MERGSRSYALPSDGSTTSQFMMMVVSSKKGSMLAVLGSGMSNMSDASMPFQPAMEEPSNAWPEVNLSSSKCETGTVVCCCLPRVSVKRKSTNLTSFSFTIFITSATVLAIKYSCCTVVKRIALPTMQLLCQRPRPRQLGKRPYFALRKHAISDAHRKEARGRQRQGTSMHKFGANTKCTKYEHS